MIKIFPKGNPRMLLCPNDLGRNCKAYTCAACSIKMNSYSAMSSNILMEKCPEMNS